MKKILLILALLLVLTMSLFSCNGQGCENADPGDVGEGGENGNDNGGENGSGELPDGTVFYGPEVGISIIRSPGVKYTFDFNFLIESIAVLSGKVPILNSDVAAITSNELVIGDTERDITKKAHEKLQSGLDALKKEFEDKNEDPSFITGYAFYYENGSLAIVWENSYAESYAYDYFIENFVKGHTLVIPEGYLNVQAFSYIDALREEEAAVREKKFETVETMYGKEVADALRHHLVLFDEDFYIWLANLYDPGEYDEEGNPLGGGFYYSNSGRDTPGYNIDIESTNQALGFLSSAGLLTGTSSNAALSEKMKKEIVTFVLSCQSSEDGYFYHPQWDSVQTSRISRDLSWATSLLSSFGAKPYWDTPSGVKGVLGAPGPNANQPVSLRLSESASMVTAVSKVVPAAKWTGSSQLATLENWEAYILKFGETIRTSSYSIGNTVGSQGTQIKTRDALAIENGELPDNNNDGRADGGYIDMLEYYFNLWQLDYNGTWAHNKSKDPVTGETYDDPNGENWYTQINGLMKISSFYNSIGMKFLNADKAFQSAANMAIHLGDGEDWSDVMGKKPSSSVDVYNPWVALSALISNINKFGNASEADALRKQLQDNAVELIKVSTIKAAKFEKEDGSFGYTWTTSPANSQGAPVAVPNTVEGDVNGGVIALTGIYGNMCSALGISDKPLPFGRSDLLKFLKIVNGLEHVVKADATLVEVDPLTFDDEVPGSITSGDVEGLKLSLGTTGKAKAEIVEDPRGKGNVLLFSTSSGEGHSITINTAKVSGAQRMVLEWEMCFAEIRGNASTAFQIKLGPSAYMLTLGIDKSGILTVGDSSSTGSGTKNFFTGNFNAKDWNSFRVEFYVLDANERTTVAKIYVNDDLRFISSNYMGHESEKTPTTVFNNCEFYMLQSTSVDYYIDDIYAYQTKDGYVEEPIVDPDRIKNFDRSSTSLPNGVTASAGSIVSAPTEEKPNNNIFVLDKAGDIKLSKSNGASNPNVYLTSAKMKIDAESVGSVGTFSFGAGEIKTAFIKLNIETYEEGDELFVRFTDVDEKGNKGTVVGGIAVGEWFEITVEFFAYRYAAGNCLVITVGDEVVGRSSLYYGINYIGRAFSAAIVENTSGSAIISLDDVIVEAVEKKYVDEEGNEVDDPADILPAGGKGSDTAAADDHNGEFDFEDYELGVPKVPGLATKPNSNIYGNNMEIAIDPTNAANKVLMHQIVPHAGTKVNNYSTLKASKEVVDGANCYVAEFDMLVEKHSSTFQFMAYGAKADGNLAMLYSLNINMTGNWVTGSGTLEIMTKHDTDSSLTLKQIGKVTVSGWTNIRFEFYTDKGVVQIYVNDSYLGETSVGVITDMSIIKSYDCIRPFHTLSSEGTVYFDNVSAKSIVKEYEAH